MSTLEHTWYKCDGRCRDEDWHGCNYCDGGLSACTVCGGAEGTLTARCVGVRLGAFAQDLFGGGLVDEVFLHEHKTDLGPASDVDVLHRHQEVCIIIDVRLTPDDHMKRRQQRLGELLELFRQGPDAVEAALVATRLLETA